MKTNKTGRNDPQNDKGERIRAATVAAGVSAALCFVLFAFTVSDCENYCTDDSVPASVSFTPPKKAEEEGFWDIFSETVIRLFNIEG